MSMFPIDEGACGAGTGSYEAGLITLSNGEARGVEDIARLTPRNDGGAGRNTALQTLPRILDALRGALPLARRLSMPARLAVSTVRAGLGAIEEGLVPEGSETLAVEIAFGDGAAIVARMPSALVAEIRRDREIALAVVARASRSVGAPVHAEPEPPATSTEALTSIFRYEKRNGRLRRIAERDPSPKV